MKKIAYLTPIVALILAIFRFFVIKDGLEPATGFVKSTWMVAVFYGLLILAVALSLALKFFMKPVDGGRFAHYFQNRSPVYAVAALLAAVGFLALAWGGYRDAGAVHAENFVWQSLCVITALLSGIAFLGLIPPIFGKLRGLAVYLAFLPVLFSVFLLLTTFLRYAALANVMDRLLDYGMLLCTMLFFTMDARLRTGTGDYRKLYCWGLAASTMILVTTVPRFMAKLAGLSYFTGFSVLSAAYLLLMPYLLFTVFQVAQLAQKPKRSAD